MRLLTLPLAAVSLAIAANAAHAQDSGIEIGKAAPSVVVQSLDGKDVNLSRFIGKAPILMEFWATWCPNCKELEPTLKSVAAKYAGKVTFIGMAVSVNENPQRVQAFVKAHELPGEHFFDTHGNASDAYNVPATSFVVVIDKAGKVVYTGQGGQQNLESAIKKAL